MFLISIIDPIPPHSLACRYSGTHLLAVKINIFIFQCVLLICNTKKNAYIIIGIRISLHDVMHVAYVDIGD